MKLMKQEELLWNLQDLSSNIYSILALVKKKSHNKVLLFHPFKKTNLFRCYLISPIFHVPYWSTTSDSNTPL